MGEWKLIRINDCCEILDNLRVPLNAEQRVNIQGSIPYYGANGVQGHINKFIFDEDLILIAEDGGNFDEFSTRPIAYRISGKSWVNNHAHILKAKQGFNQDFIFFSLVNKNILYFIQGGTRSKLNQSDLKNITLNIPNSEKEQETITNVLNKIDQTIEKTEQLIAKYERIKTGLMQDVLTRGIDENGHIRTEGGYEFKDSPLGRIPKEWEVRQLGNVAKFVSGRAWSFKQLSEYGLRIIRISNLHKPDFPFWFYKGSFKDEWLVKKGDILFSWAGVASSIDCVKYLGETSLLNQHIYNLKIEKEEEKEFTHRYVNWILPEIRREIEGGAGQLHLTKDKIESINIPFPKEKELLRINERLSAFEKLVETENEYVNKLRAQKKALMQDLLTGKVRVDSLIEIKK